MCKTYNNIVIDTVCNKTKQILRTFTVPDQNIQTTMTQHLLKNMSKIGLAVYFCAFMWDGGIRADAPVVISLKEHQSACVYLQS